MKHLLLVAAAAVMIVGCRQSEQPANAAANVTADADFGNGLAASAGTAAPGTGLTAAEVAAMIERDGATRTVQTLDQGETTTRFTQVLDGIASGDAQWLALVPRLAPGVDAGTSTGLIVSVAQALPRNAAGVLRLAGNGWSTEDACSYPMIEPTAEETRAYFAAAIPAVEGVSEPGLQGARADCLQRLRAAQRQAG